MQNMLVDSLHTSVIDPVFY